MLWGGEGGGVWCVLFVDPVTDTYIIGHIKYNLYITTQLVIYGHPSNII